MQYPVDCITTGEKMEYLYAAQEKLRKLHNVFSLWVKDGLSQQLYDKLPAKVQAIYPYIEKLSVEDFKKFIKEDMEPKSQKIFDELGPMREAMKVSTRWNIAVEDI